MRRSNWTECDDGGWSNGPYHIETLGNDLWVLSRDHGSCPELLTSAGSASELEAFTSVHRKVDGAIRPLVLITTYLMTLAGVVAGSVTGSTISVVIASLATVGVMTKVSEYMTGRRVVRARMPASVR